MSWKRVSSGWQAAMIARCAISEVVWRRAQVLMMVDLAFEHFDRKQLEQFYWAQARGPTAQFPIATLLSL
eukprot:2936310-Prymnesium_polylepis.1